VLPPSKRSEGCIHFLFLLFFMSSSFCVLDLGDLGGCIRSGQLECAVLPLVASLRPLTLTTNTNVVYAGRRSRRHHLWRLLRGST
jgi:hypothetical protein